MPGWGTLYAQELEHDIGRPETPIASDGNPERWRIVLSNKDGKNLCTVSCRVEDDMGYMVVLSGAGSVDVTGVIETARVYSDQGFRVALRVIDTPMWHGARTPGMLRLNSKTVLAGDQVELHDVQVEWG
jgi:hypothetical protein